MILGSLCAPSGLGLQPARSLFCSPRLPSLICVQEHFSPADLADLAAQGEQAPLLMSGCYLRFDAGG